MSPVAKALTERVELVVTLAERKRWKWAAEQSGLTLSAWIRLRVNGHEITAPVKR